MDDRMAGNDRPRRLSQYQVMVLVLQFLVGMVFYVVGIPSRATGSAHTASLVVLSAHVLLAAGLSAGAVWIIRATAATRDWRRSTPACSSRPLTAALR
jgi:hypothetical protein